MSPVFLDVSRSPNGGRCGLRFSIPVQQLLAQGKSLPEVLAAKVTTSYDAKVPDGLLPAGAAGTSADRFVSMVYSELKGKERTADPRSSLRSL